MSINQTQDSGLPEATLFIAGPGLDPDDVTRVLGNQPHKTARGDHPRWFWTSAGHVASADADDHLRAVLGLAKAFASRRDAFPGVELRTSLFLPDKARCRGYSGALIDELIRFGPATLNVSSEEEPVVLPRRSDPERLRMSTESSGDVRRGDVPSGEFHRIRRLPPYVFAEVNAAKAKARTAGEDIIDLGMGNPDSPTPRHIVDKLIETVQDPRSHRYSVSQGIPGLRRALATYYQRRFDVGLNPDTEVVATLGSKEGLANLASAITSPGDTILVPNPSYPIHQFGFIIAGAGVRSIPATPDDEMLRALDRAVRHSVPKPTALIVNFPSNPTAYLADLDFYRELVAFARRHEIWIMSDLAYAEIYFDESKPPPSILQVPGAKDIAVEFTSLSKTYSMPGWRMGFAAGNERLIRALTRMKSYLDYGAFTPIQVAAATALTGPQECVAEMRALYKDRRDVFIKGLINIGWDMPLPEGSMFAWAPIPPKYASLGSVEFSKLLMARAKVAVAPGLGFGEHGDTHVRIALVENNHRLRQALRNIKQFLNAGTNVTAEAETHAAAQ